MLSFQYYPKNKMITKDLRNIINVFEQNYDKIPAINNNKYKRK